MKLYLLRHSDAEKAKAKEQDSERPLTELGRQQSLKTAAEVKAKGIIFDIILTSPYLRAHQTAEIVANAVGMRDKLIKEPLLAPGCDFGEMIELLDNYKDCEGVLIVGHEPDLGEIAGQFLCLDGPRPLKKAELVEIDL